MFGYSGGSTATADHQNTQTFNINPNSFATGGVTLGNIAIGGNSQSGDASSTGGTSSSNFSMDLSMPNMPKSGDAKLQNLNWVKSAVHGAEAAGPYVLSAAQLCVEFCPKVVILI